MNDRSRVEQAAQMLATELRTIQKRADSGENTCDSNQKFLGYEISQPVDETKIDYYPICDLSGVETTGAIKSFSLANGMSAKISDFPFRILSLGRGVDKVVSITLFKGDIKYRVDITKAGGISVVK